MPQTHNQASGKYVETSWARGSSYRAIPISKRQRKQRKRDWESCNFGRTSDRALDEGAGRRASLSDRRSAEVGCEMARKYGEK